MSFERVGLLENCYIIFRYLCPCLYAELRGGGISKIWTSLMYYFGGGGGGGGVPVSDYFRHVGEGLCQILAEVICKRSLGYLLATPPLGWMYFTFLHEGKMYLFQTIQSYRRFVSTENSCPGEVQIGRII